MSNHIRPNPHWIADVRSSLAKKIHQSLDHLLFEADSQNDHATIDRETFRRLLIGDDNFPSASIFAANSALIDAALSNDQSQFDEDRKRLERLCQTSAYAPRSLNVTGFSEEILGLDEFSLLQRAFADDVGLTVSLLAPSDQEVSTSAEQLNDALKLIASTPAPWEQELLALAPQVFLAKPSTTATQPFGGAAVFAAFGSVLMNPNQFYSKEQVALSLIHETSHLQMFLFHLDDPVVLNDEKATFSSPLRRQPRPMEGIFHAMWVSARMMAAGRDLLELDKKTVDHEIVEQIVNASDSAFRDCAGTIKEFGELSSFGKELFGSAERSVYG